MSTASLGSPAFHTFEAVVPAGYSPSSSGSGPARPLRRLRRHLPTAWGGDLLAADQAEELLDPDSVETSQDRVAADPKDRNALAVQLLPLRRRGRVMVDRPLFDGDP